MLIISDFLHGIPTKKIFKIHRKLQPDRTFEFHLSTFEILMEINYRGKQTNLKKLFRKEKFDFGEFLFSVEFFISIEIDFTDFTICFFVVCVLPAFSGTTHKNSIYD